MSAPRRLVRPFAVAASAVALLVSVSCVALAGDGAMSDAIRSALQNVFGGAPVRVTSTPSDGQVLTYDSGTGTWRAESAAGGAQTPWASAIDGADYNLTGVDALDANSMEVQTGDLAVTAGDLNVYGGTINGGMQTHSITTGVGSETVISGDDAGESINNQGTTVKASCTLPAAAIGKQYYVSVVDTDGLRVNATGNDTISLGHMTTGAAGYVESLRVGSSFHIVATTSSAWVAHEVTGTWRADSTTSAGYAYTPTEWMTATMSHTWDADADVSETAYVRQDGSEIEFRGQIVMAGAPATATLAVSALTVGGISYMPDETNMLAIGGHSGGTSTAELVPLGGHGDYNGYLDDGTGYYIGLVLLYSKTADTFSPCTAGISATVANITQAAPITWANHDMIVLGGTWKVQ